MSNPKPIRLTKHAATVMAERALPEEAVLQTAAHPDWVERDQADPSRERRFRAIPEKAGRIMRVVCVETAEELRILTAFLDRGARKPG